MASTAEQHGWRSHVPDAEFFRVFLPYELLLSQRRAQMWTMLAEEALPKLFVGLYLARLKLSTTPPPDASEELAAHVRELLRDVLRDSDIVGTLSVHEQLAVARDVDFQQAYVVAQRLLAAAARSTVLTEAGAQLRLGYLIYPLSAQANLQPELWTSLVDLTRRLTERDHAGGPPCGWGLLRGPRMSDNSIPESDLLSLAFQDADGLVKAGILRLQRIQLLTAR